MTRRVVTLPLLVAAFFLLTAHEASAATPTPPPTKVDPQIDAAKKRKDLIDQVRQKLGSSLADALVAQQQIENSLKDNARQQEALKTRISDAQARVDALDAEIAKLDAEIAATDHRITIERAQLRSLARAIYTEPGSMLVLLAESNDLGELVTRISDLSSAGSRARALKAKLNEDMARLDAARKKQTAARAEQVKVRDGLQANLAKLEDLRRQQEKSKADLDAKVQETKKEITNVDHQSSALAQQIADLLREQQDEIIAAAMQQVWDQVKVWQDANLGITFTTSSGHSTKYRFVWPEQGTPAGPAVITQGFGPTDLWMEPMYNGFAHFHTGIDLAEPENSPILAADDGVVILVGSGPYGYGNYVVLAHAGGFATLYGHMNTPTVKVGQTVKQGQLIGLEGSTGASTGPHLHFELRVGGKMIDPSPFLPPSPPSPYHE
jgi:murein DD-endopeptidase MepM/ murein hydrolase activator NlpD